MAEPLYKLHGQFDEAVSSILLQVRCGVVWCDAVQCLAVQYSVVFLGCILTALILRLTML